MLRIKVAFTYIAYPVAMGRYFLNALLRRADVEVWVAGPYSGRWIPWQYGLNMPERYVLKPDHPLPLGSPPTLAYPMLQPPWEPDLWLEVNAALKTIGRPPGRYAVVGSDPHVVDYTPQRSVADYFFGMQSPYLKAGDIHLPYAYDPGWHTPTTIPPSERKFDAALLGLAYPQRIELVAALRKRGMAVAFDIGQAYEEARFIYHNTRVGLNWSSMQDTNARAFELMAFGLPAVMNRVPDLLAMFKDGEHFVGFDSQAEAVSAVADLLQDHERAARIAFAGLEAVRAHTYDARVQTILETVGLVPKAKDAGV